MISPFASRSTCTLGVFLAALVVIYVASVRKPLHHQVIENESLYDFYSRVRNDQIISSDKDWEPLVGYWKGTLNSDLRLIFRVAHTYGQVFGYSLDQGGQFIPATATRFNPSTNNLHFFFDTIQGLYSAKLDPTGQKMTGTWKQYGSSMSLDYYRYNASSVETRIPSEIQFAVEKFVTGDSETLLRMEGFWSGYFDDGDSDDEDQPDSATLVVIQMEKLGENLVEPKLFLPYVSSLPMTIRSFVIDCDGKVKIVQDTHQAGRGTIFYGKLDNKTLTGVIKYDDTDDTPPLTLTWSAENPDRTVVEAQTSQE